VKRENPFLGKGYNTYTITSVDNLLCEESYLSARLGVVDDAAKRVLMRLYLRVPFYEIRQFLGMGEIPSRLQDISARMIGKKFFEPGKDFQKTVESTSDGQPLVVGLADHNRAISLEECIRYDCAYPVKGFFESFSEEKGLRRDYSAPLCGFGWGKAYAPQNTFNGIDSGIVELVRDLNRIDFVYTKGESCSGIPDDHEQKYVDNGKPDFGFRKGEKGFIILRIDGQDPRFLPFSRGLQRLCCVELIKVGYEDPDNDYQKQNGIQNLAIVIPVPQNIASNPNHPNYVDYLSSRWDKVHEFVKIFIAPTEVEQVKESILKERQERLQRQREYAERLKAVIRQRRDR